MNIRRHGVALIVVGCVFWSFGGVLSKTVPWGAVSLTGFRALIAAVALALLRRDFRPVNTPGTWIGALGVTATSTLFIFANKLTSAANAIVLQYAMPVVVILFEAVVGRRRPPRKDVCAVAAVCAGVALCFCQGFSGGGMLGNALALLSAFTNAAIYLAARRSDCDALSYSYQGVLLSSPLAVALLFDPAVRPDAVEWLAAAAMGLCVAGGYLFFSLGMRAGVSPVTAAIVSNVEPILNPTWCFVFRGENPGALSIAGAVVVLGAVTVYTVVGMRGAKRVQSDHDGRKQER